MARPLVFSFNYSCVLFFCFLGFLFACFFVFHVCLCSLCICVFSPQPKSRHPVPRPPAGSPIQPLLSTPRKLQGGKSKWNFYDLLKLKSCSFWPQTSLRIEIRGWKGKRTKQFKFGWRISILVPILRSENSIQSTMVDEVLWLQHRAVISGCWRLPLQVPVVQT